MNTPFGRLASPALFTMLSLIGLCAQAEAQKPSLMPAIQGYKAPSELALLECGPVHFKATLHWTGQASNALAIFENPVANAVCGNTVIDTEKLKLSSGVVSPTSPLMTYRPIQSYDNGNLLNVSAYFNPGLRRTLRKGRTETLACGNQLAQAEVVDLQDVGLVSLKFQNSQLNHECGEGRYFQITKILAETIRLQKSGTSSAQIAYSEAGYMECGLNYYAAALESQSGSSDSRVHFLNPNAQYICGQTVYDSGKLTEGRGFMATQWPKFLRNARSESSTLTFLNETRFKRGQVVNHVACKNNLGKAQVMNVNVGYGLVAFHFENAQLDALCGQGRYHFTSKVIKAGDALMERMKDGQVNYFAN